MRKWMGPKPNEFYAQINSEAKPREDGTVWVWTQIRYGSGHGTRITQLTTEQAEQMGVELIQAAQQAADMKVAAEERARRKA